MLRFLSCRAASRRGGELGGPSALRERCQFGQKITSLVNSYFVTTVKEGGEMLIGSSDASRTRRN